MVEIKLSQLDQKDLIELLNYALEKKKEEPKETGKHHWDNTGWYEIRVHQLKQIVKGRKVYDTIYQSSLGGLIEDIEEGLDNDFVN